MHAEQGMTHEEQEKAFDQIRSDHEKLRKDYLQAKEDYNARKRSSATGGDTNFDDNKELEGELFKLGMKFDEIHEKVEEKRKEKHSQRQPFATNRIQSDSDAMTSGMSDQETQSVDQMKKKIKVRVNKECLFWRSVAVVRKTFLPVTGLISVLIG